MTRDGVKKRLQEIGVLMRGPGANLEELSKEIDRLLGTEQVKEDSHLAGIWERQSRRGKR